MLHENLMVLLFKVERFLKCQTFSSCWSNAQEPLSEIAHNLEGSSTLGISSKDNILKNSC